ncbi:FAD-dependent oxidoreductase [Antrihabitans stalactiti]|uniref:GMC family oxidoreductase n=1 Tax=Antrihabitans stalactiti TaxID=2584121 RepID=A0A848KK76_9NOCA|nr:GMC family oxidoreductase [Antrihabitans stalactiti]NMN96257.1 GMC family oxidoreductase [Antrihabitans stalactiti]
MTEWMTTERQDALRAICDTIVPAIEHAEDADGFWARKASDLGVDIAIVGLLEGMPPELREGLLGLVDVIGAQGIVGASQQSREVLLSRTALLGPEATVGVGALIQLTTFLSYGLPDPNTGKNPNWVRLGYPGPVSLPQPAAKPIKPLVPSEDQVLEADVVIVGSGAGGGTIAGKLAQAGMKVVVLEAAGYFDESDFNQLELWAYQNLYWRGGPVASADFNISLQAGATLGGGTTINWMTSLRTKPWVREEWAREFGLEGVDTAEFDRHLDAVSQRISVNGDTSDYNSPTLRLKEAAEKLGWSFQKITRNSDASKYDPVTAAYIGFGDQTGSKQGTMKSYLQDAFDAGADILVRTRASRVIVENGRAAGVEATYSDPASGASSKVTVRAPRVVVAGGSLESPALLLRSGIGGPAVGNYLRLHPVTALCGVYAEEQQGWWGPAHSGLVDQFANPGNGYGFLLETAHYTTAASAAFLPFSSPAEHKALMSQASNMTWLLALVRDHGHGRVTIDANGEAVASYPVSDPLDVANLQAGIGVLAQVHRAAGAIEMRALSPGLPRWRWGDDLDAYVARLQAIPFRAGGHRMFSAHQMGTCRMGTDPQTSVAGPFGELHDTPGVWIGDGSAFPSPSGTNPMLSIMALAHRTAEAIAASADKPLASAQA